MHIVHQKTESSRVLALLSITICPSKKMWSKEKEKKKKKKKKKKQGLLLVYSSILYFRPRKALFPNIKSNNKQDKKKKKKKKKEDVYWKGLSFKLIYFFFFSLSLSLSLSLSSFPLFFFTNIIFFFLS